MAFVRLAAAADIAPDKSLAVEHEGRALLICHSAGGYFVTANRCSHAEEPLDCGRVRNGWVACPIHGARFDLASGRPMNPPATEPIVTYPARIIDGWVEADLDG